MDDGAAEVSVVAVKADDLSLPERLMRAEQTDDNSEVKRILKQVHYCWPQTELVR